MSIFKFFNNKSNMVALSDDTQIEGLNEIHLSGTEQREEDGYVVKEILRTGEWPAIPTRAGLVRKPLRIVRDGESNVKEGVIALQEVVDNFHNGPFDRVQVPLSDTQDDHKNLTANNTGFVRDLWIVDDDNGSKLVAKIEFTEPEVKEKVLRGTYADVSCGIPWSVRSRGQTFGASLEHVAITNRPFIDGLGPFMAASDNGDIAPEDVAHFAAVTDEVVTDIVSAIQSENPADRLRAIQKILDLAAPSEENQLEREQIIESVKQQLKVFGDFESAEVGVDEQFVTVKKDNKTWTIPFNVDQGEVKLGAISDWQVHEGEQVADNEPLPTHVGNGNSPSANSDKPVSELEEARWRRGIRLAASNSDNSHERGNNMPLKREDLEKLELSDDARSAIQDILDQNAALAASAREAEVDRRVDELKELGLSERPGFLKLYRQVALSDDGGPAVVVLSDNGQAEAQYTAVEILDRAVEALKAPESQKIELSAQHVASGSENKPPNDASGENKTAEERYEETKKALYGDNS